MHNAKLLQKYSIYCNYSNKKIEENGQPHSTVIINVKNYLEKLQYA